MYLRGIMYWFSISVSSFILYYFLWFITDKSILLDDGFSWCGLLKDFSYCALLSALTLLACHLITRIKHFRTSTLPRISLLTFIIFTISLAIAQGVEMLWNYQEPVFESTRIMDVYFFSIITTLVSTIFISRYYSKIVASKSHANNLLKMKLLKGQLDPHFMFNSLNTLAELIHEKPEVAEDFAIRLSNVYRYIIQNFNDDVVSIHDAIYVTGEYCKLLESRYPNNFIFKFDKRIEELFEYKILPLSIQQLVENAIKHNRHSSSKPLCVSFTLQGRYICVRNDYAPIKDESVQTNGIGLNNLKNRYLLLCGVPVIINKTDEFFEVKLPIIYNYENTDNRGRGDEFFAS